MVLHLKVWESRSLPGLLALQNNNKHDAGWSSPVARQAHNLKVVGSNPTPATNYIYKINDLDHPPRIRFLGSFAILSDYTNHYANRSFGFLFLKKVFSLQLFIIESYKFH